MISILTCLCILMLYSEPGAKPENRLGDAIEQFNADTRNDPVGSTQQPLTEKEVVAAIRFWNDPDAPVSAEMSTTFKQIAKTRILPENASFEKLTGYDRGGEFIFDVWSVRIRLERPDKSSYAFVIRETMVGSRTVQEELERIKKLTGVAPSGERIPGWYRIEKRIRDLERRVRSHGTLLEDE